MTRLPLPLLVPARTEFGFCRTACACTECSVFCRHLPGYLVPADLQRINDHLSGEDLLAWAEEYLCASPGAVVAPQGILHRIPTLVPARREDGACIFLTEEGQCRIHSNAPYGCAFFDSHQPKTEADQRSSAGLRAILEAFETGALYAQIWVHLFHTGLRATAPEVRRPEIHKWKRNTVRSGTPPNSGRNLTFWDF